MINNRYEIIEKIGEGRSKVFSCKDKFFPKEKIAIKILQYTASDDEIEAFNNEYEILKRLSHPNIISVFDKGTILHIEKKCKARFSISENDKFITMERVEGKTFDNCSALENDAELKNIIHQICLALFYIHQANYIYFDLKPENILISNSNSGLKIKLIDFGLTKYFPDLKSNYLRGTSEYLAPEILKKEDISFNVDFYSFGILLYHLAYQNFPFRNENELEIFRAHIGKNFEFPSSKYSNKIIAIVKKMLAKNPYKRYGSSLEIIDDLQQEITFREKLNLTNALNYVERENTNIPISNYIHGDIWGKVAVLLGEKGIGKSLLLESISKQYKNTVLIRINNFISAANFWQQFFSRLLYSEPIYRSIDDSLIQYVSLHIDDNSDELLVELKTIISKIASVTNFILIIDDFDKLENHYLEMLFELFPILLANQIKIIIAMHNLAQIDFPNGIERENIELKPFSDEEVAKLVYTSYNKFINRKELENLILSFSERTPLKISLFISELIASGILDFSDGKSIAKYNDSKITKLLSSQNDIFELLKENLEDKELAILETISLFENDISFELLSSISKIPPTKTSEIILSLREKNILRPSTQNRNASFINSGFKQFIYNGLLNFQSKHLEAGKIILKSFPEVDVLVKIRQFELANNFDEATSIIDKSLQATNIINFPQIKIKLLQKKLSYNIKREEEIKTQLILCEIYYSIGKYTEALKIIKLLERLELSKYYMFQKDWLFGTLLIKTGKLSKGVKILLKVVDNLPNQKEIIFLELSSAYIELGEFAKADSICREILKNPKSVNENIGRAQNLLGISNLYNKSNLNITFRFFKDAHKTYTKENNFNRIAGSEVNLGNIQNILGNFSKAEKHWNKALQLNRSIGNVEQEANVLLSTGVFYYEHANYEKAVGVYNKAGDIFKGLGNKFSFGLVNTNLSETYLEISEYQRAQNSIIIAKEIFTDLKNNDELLEVLLIEGKLFILIGNMEGLRKTRDKIEEFLPIKSERGILLLQFYTEYINKENSGVFDLEKINMIKKKLSQNNDRLLATELQFLLANEYFKMKEFGISISLLHSKNLTDICEFNAKYEAQRLFILSKIPTKYQSDLTLTKIYLLHRAYAILKNISISELTLNVLSDLAKFYFDRGNLSKAKKFALLAETIIKYITLETVSEEILKSLLDNRLTELIEKIDEVLGTD